MRKGSIILWLAIPFVGYFLITYAELDSYSKNIEAVVGIIAILSGITGILMGLASARQASLAAVKEYYQQGDSEQYVIARRYMTDNHDLKTIEDYNNVADIMNFYELWGLLNRKNYLPIWVFGGVSGIRVVEMYVNLYDLINAVRKGELGEGKSENPFYAKQFEELAYRIYRQYQSNFKHTNFEEKYKDKFKEFKKNAGITSTLFRNILK